MSTPAERRALLKAKLAGRSKSGSSPADRRALLKSKLAGGGKSTALKPLAAPKVEIPEDQPSFGNLALKTVEFGAERFDSVTGAPTRAGLSSLIAGKGLADSLSTFAKQVGAPASTAPTGEDIAKQLGAGDELVFPPTTLGKTGFQSSANVIGSVLGGSVGGIAAQELSKTEAGQSVRKALTQANALGVGIEFAADPIAIAGGLSKGIKTGVKGFSKLIRFLSKAKDASRAANAGKVIKAGKLIGAPITPGQLSDSRVVKSLESSLEKSLTLSASGIRGARTKQFKALTNVAEEITDDASKALGTVGTGEAVQTGLIKSFNQSVAPAEEIYNKLEKGLSNVPISKQGMKIALNRIKKTLSKQFSGAGADVVKELEKIIPNINTVEDLRMARTSLGQMLGPDRAKNEVVNKVYKALSREMERSIVKGFTRRGAKIGRQARNKEARAMLKRADTIYAKAFTDAKDALPNILKKKFRGKGGFAEPIEKLPFELMGQKAFDVKNIKQLRKFKKTFPKQFDQLRIQKVSDILEKSISPGDKKLSIQKLISNLDALTPEARLEIFGPGSEKKFQAIRTFTASIPGNINPPNTAEAIEIIKMFTPGGIAREGARFLQAKFLKLLGGEVLKPSSGLIEVGSKVPFKKVLGAGTIRQFRDKGDSEQNALKRRNK